MKSFSLIILCAVIFTTDTVSADQYVVENSVLHDIKRSPSQHYGRVLAFEGVVTNLFTGLGTKLFIEIGHESKLEPLMVNLLFDTADQIKVGERLKVLGYFSDIPKTIEPIIEYSQSFSLIGFCVVNLSSKKKLYDPRGRSVTALSSTALHFDHHS